MPDLKQQLLHDGILQSPTATLTPFTGGVSSDVYLVTDGPRKFVVKQALATLRTRDHWTADPARSVTERDCLRYVGERLPGVVPQLLASGDGYFTMEYLGPGFANWKTTLFSGDTNPATAARAAEILGNIHRLSYLDDEARKLFATGELFHQLRISPYLLTTADRHPELRSEIEAEATRLAATHESLVHGDYSPKNILIRANPPRTVILDCEVAWFGDPAFDLSFLLTHLLLKGLFHPTAVCTAAAIDAYFLAITTTPSRKAELDHRTARLTQMLLLARVDGKSPAEYLTPTHHTFIRDFVYANLKTATDLATLTTRWFSTIPDANA